MPRPLTPLPEDLPFAFTTAEGRELGLGTPALRHRRFERPFRGTRVLADAERAGLSRSQHIEFLARCYAPKLRQGEVFSHVTALVLLGCPVRSSPVLHVTSPRPLTPPRASGVRGHSTSSTLDVVEGSSRLPVSAPAQALQQAAALISVRELVVAIDFLITDQRTNHDTHLGAPPRIAELSEVARAPTRGVRNLRRALGLARVGSGSRMETLLRLILADVHLDHHFMLQQDIFDEHGWIGRFDLVCESRRLIVEYDGEQHRTHRAQYVRDEYRLDRVREAGYRVLRFRADDVLRAPLAVARRVAEAIRT